MTTATVQEAGVRQRRNRSPDVLEAAIRVFHKKGYASASIQDVAEEVGVLKGSLYHYIDSKEDLLARIFEDPAGHLGATLAGAPGAGISEPPPGHFEAMLAEAAALDAPPVERLRSFAR